MATNLVSFHPALIRASAVPAHRKPEQSRQKTGSPPSSSWWSPLFGWPSEPDYVDCDKKSANSLKAGGKSDSDPGRKPARTRISPGCFTEEKAKQLRLMTLESESFHDAMYHSAIASRLASDFKKQS